MSTDERPGAAKAATALAWVAAAAVSSAAAALAQRHATPIDAALPVIAIVATLVAWAGQSWTQVAVPLLIAAELTIPDETLRFLFFGAVLAIAFAAGIARRGMTIARAVALTAAATVILRWVPLEDVRPGREVLLLALALAITVALRATPVAVCVAVVAVFITPGVPLRTLALPLAVLVAAMVARAYRMPRIELAMPSALIVAAAMLPFAWSGVVARGALYFAARPAAAERTVVQVALAPGRRIVLDVPDGAAALIVSGANVAHLPAGTVLGTIMPGAVPVRIGDASDWGFMRRDQFYASYNGMPRSPAGRIHGYGYSAWVDGAGRMSLPSGARTIEVISAPTIPGDAALQVEGFELTP